ncbi:MAG: von Willebrand factor type A domain-containing protein [Pirellulaceae bacterium]
MRLATPETRFWTELQEEATAAPDLSTLALNNTPSREWAVELADIVDTPDADVTRTLERILSQDNQQRGLQSFELRGLASEKLPEFLLGEFYARDANGVVENFGNTAERAGSEAMRGDRFDAGEPNNAIPALEQTLPKDDERLHDREEGITPDPTLEKGSAIRGSELALGDRPDLPLGGKQGQSGSPNADYIIDNTGNDTVELHLLYPRQVDRYDTFAYDGRTRYRMAGSGILDPSGSVDRATALSQDYSGWEADRQYAKGVISPTALNEISAAEEAFSTFSLHVSDVSFKLAQAALRQGEWPDAAKVRIEEFVNAFDYGDPMPSQTERVACRIEQAIHPFQQQRNVLRISMRTAAAGRSSATPLRLTFLLDNSGSMERFDRQQAVRRGFATLAEQLQPTDQVTLISFARQPRLVADQVSGASASELVQLIENLPSEGGTNIEAALQLAFEKAREQQIDGAQNRIVLLTDGAVNLGDANPDSLSQLIMTMRDAGIAFDAAGICADGLNDEILEALTRQGDGRYYLLDSAEAADNGFAQQIAGALRPAAKNVKVQIEFNPKRVGRYKLLGFEKHLLKPEDFRNDQVDAAELSAAEAGVAMYQFEAKPKGEGDVGSVSVRFLDTSTGQMIENRWPIPYERDARRPESASPSLRIATAAALFAAKLRGEPLGESVDLKTLSDLIASLPGLERNSNRVQQMQEMLEQARRISGN